MHGNVASTSSVDPRAPDALAAHLKDQGVPTAVYYPIPLHLQPAYAGRTWLAQGKLPLTEQASKEVLSLPMHPYLDSTQQQHIVAVSA